MNSCFLILKESFIGISFKHVSQMVPPGSCCPNVAVYVSQGYISVFISLNHFVSPTAFKIIIEELVPKLSRILDDLQRRPHNQRVYFRQSATLVSPIGLAWTASYTSL